MVIGEGTSSRTVEKQKKTGSFCIKKKSLKVVKKRNVKARAHMTQRLVDKGQSD